MPDFEQRAVTGWLAELHPYDDATWPPAIRPIETTRRVSDQLVILGTALDELVPADLPRFRDALRDGPLLTELRSAMAQLGAARSLRLLHWLAEAYLSDCHDVIASLTQGHDASALALRETIEAVTRAATVRRMFAPDRIAALELACTTIQETFA